MKYAYSRKEYPTQKKKGARHASELYSMRKNRATQEDSFGNQRVLEFSLAVGAAVHSRVGASDENLSQPSVISETDRSFRMASRSADLSDRNCFRISEVVFPE